MVLLATDPRIIHGCTMPFDLVERILLRVFDALRLVQVAPFLFFVAEICDLNRKPKSAIEHLVVCFHLYQEVRVSVIKLLKTVSVSLTPKYQIPRKEDIYTWFFIFSKSVIMEARRCRASSRSAFSLAAITLSSQVSSVKLYSLFGPETKSSIDKCIFVALLSAKFVVVSGSCKLFA